MDDKLLRKAAVVQTVGDDSFYLAFCHVAVRAVRVYATFGAVLSLFRASVHRGRTGLGRGNLFLL